MKITIDEKIVEQKGLSIEEFLFLLFLKVSDKPYSEVFEQIVKDGKVYYNNEAMQTLLMDNTDDLVQTILLDSEKTVPEIEREEALAIKMQEIFPLGKKEGTSQYYRGNKKEIALKIKKFFKLYGHYTDEQILQATQKYVDSFNGNYTFMRVLKYFIIKDVRKQGEEVNYVEQVSELASYLENAGQEDYNNNWTAQLK